MGSRRLSGSSGSSSSRDVAGFSPNLKCNCGHDAVVRTVKNGVNIGMKFYGCPKWPETNCEFFRWVNVNNPNVNKDVDDLRFQVFEKDTLIAEKEIEINFIKETLKKVELKLEYKDEELKDTKMELSYTRIELMKASRNEKNFSLTLFLSWVFFALLLVYLKA